MRIDRAWAMPNKSTFRIPPIGILVRTTVYENHDGLWVDPFSGGLEIADVTNDLNPALYARFNMKAKDFLAERKSSHYAGLILDPPYSPRQIKECYEGVGLHPTTQETSAAFWGNLKDEAQRILKVGGVVITCGWNSNGVGKSRGFEIERILIVAHGGWHNDTIVTVERKVR